MKTKIITATALSVLLSFGVVVAQSTGSPTDQNNTVSPSTPGSIGGSGGTEAIPPLDPGTTGSVNQGSGRDCTVEDDLNKSTAQNEAIITGTVDADTDNCR